MKNEAENKCRSLSVTEINAIEKANKRGKKTKDVFCVVDREGKKKIEASNEKDLSAEDIRREFISRIQDTTGAVSLDVGLDLLRQVYETLVNPHDPLDQNINRLNVVAKMMQALEPKDEIEGQLISQLAVLHEQSMMWLGKAFRTERVDFANVYLNGASKLLVRYTEALAAFQKYRRGGEQRVHVEHVHVHGGAQAIVGNINNGGGGREKFEEGPHAKV